MSELTMKRRAPQFPQWYDDQVLAAWNQSCQGHPVPAKLDELWRMGKYRKVDFTAFSPASGDVEAVAPAPRLSGCCQIVACNGRLTSHSPLPDGVEVLSLAEWIAADESIAQSWLAQNQPSLGSEAFAAWHRAMMDDAVVVKVHEGVRIESPIEIIWSIVGHDAVIFPYTLILVGERAEVNILERYWGESPSSRQLVMGAHNILAGAEALVRYALLQEMKEEGVAFSLGHLRLQQQARLEHLSVHAGAKWARQELICTMDGPEAWAELMSVADLSGEQYLDQRTRQMHLVPGSGSNLTYKNVLRDRARSVFGGMIYVGEGAHGTDAYQSNKNLLLSEKAEADSMPGLEILADHVRCSHGTASSFVDPEQLFYLLSRGIPEDEAERMIASGFLQGALDHFHQQAIVDAVMAALGC